MLASGKEGRIWTGVDPDAVPDEERERVVKALGYLEQRGLVELKVTDVRQRFTLLQQPPPRDELRDRLRDGLRQVRASAGDGGVCTVVEVAPWSRIPEQRALLVARDD